MTAAAGALGHWFVPLAKRAGAEATGAAGGERKVAAVTEPGADRGVDYSLDGWADGTGMLDVVLDGVGGAIGRAGGGDATTRWSPEQPRRGQWRLRRDGREDM